MMSGEFIEEMLEELKEKEKKIKKSEEREIEITKKFNESMRKLSFLL